MAKVTIEVHNISVPGTSGSRTFQVSYTSCVPVSVSTEGGNMQFTNLSLDNQGNVVAQWGENNTGAERATVITVTAEDTGGGVVTGLLAFNQNGGNYNVTIDGEMTLTSDVGSKSYSIISTNPGNFNAYSETPWLSVSTLQKTSPNAGTMVLSYVRNQDLPRLGVVRFVFSFESYPYNAYHYMVLYQPTYLPPTPSSSSISYNPDTVSVNYSAGSFTSNPPLLTNVGNLTVRNVSGTMNITSVDIDPNNGRLIVVYGANTSSNDLSATISVRGTGASGYVSTTFYIYQSSYKYVVGPIWKTMTVDVEGKPFVDYTISTEGDVIYSGRAYRMPGKDNISFEINEVVRDYIDNYLWWRQGYQTPLGWQRTFTLEMTDGSKTDYIFTKDWSYEEKNYSSTAVICLNDPIIKQIPAGCFVPVCVFSPQRAGTTSFNQTNTQGSTTSAYSVNLNNSRQARYLFISTPGYKYGYSGAGLSNNEVYEGAADCKTRYVLYYENAFGGFDALPIQGNALATDNITAYTTKNSVSVPSRDFSYRRYLNEITKTWKLNTTYLSDEQASKMHHLIESTEVYLYDIETTEVYPVVIDDTSVEYKTYKNQGRKFFNYSFNVKESQNKIRK